MRKKFILIGHKKRHGKDTLAAQLKDYIPNSRIIAFAYPMKDIISEMKGMTIAEYNMLKNTSDSYRREIQIFGNSKMKEYFGKDVWKDLLVRRAEECEEEYIIVPDFRFPNELLKGAITINVIRPGLENNDTHESETAMDGFEYDITIVNDGTIDDLDEKADLLGEHIIKNFKEKEQRCQKQRKM